MIADIIERAHPGLLPEPHRARLLTICKLLEAGPVSVADVHRELWPDSSLPAANKALRRLAKIAARSRVGLSIEGGRSLGDRRTVSLSRIGYSATEMGCAPEEDLASYGSIAGVII